MEPDFPDELTARAVAIRGRIIRAAADVMYRKCIAATTTEDVLQAASVSTTQLHAQFPNWAHLVHEVIALRGAEMYENQRAALSDVVSIRGLREWRNDIVERSVSRYGAGGCELGALASELADADEVARKALNGHFLVWRELLAGCLERMRDAGILRADIDAARTATGLMAALQGGYLLAQTAHSPVPMEAALDFAIEHVESYQVSEGSR